MIPTATNVYLKSNNKKGKTLKPVKCFSNAVGSDKHGAGTTTE